MSPTTRPPVLGSQHAVSSTHYLATSAAQHVYARGGNAVDAGVAAGVALGVVERAYVDFGGIAPVMIHSPGSGEPVTYDGVGRWPGNLTLSEYAELYGTGMPHGVARAVVPGAAGAWLSALADHGRLSLADVLQPAIELARGFPVSHRLANMLAAEAPIFSQWPTTAAVLLPGGSPPTPGDILVQHDLRRLLERLCAAERASEGSREDRILAARDEFYQGEIAEQIARFVADEGGHLSMHDMRAHRTTQGAAATTSYRGFKIHGSGAYSQGPVIPMVFNLLEHAELAGTDPHDPRVLHLLVEAIELAFADRDGFFGDPEHVDVPLQGLLSKSYGEKRRELMGERRSWLGLPLPGEPWSHEGRTGPPGHVPHSTSGPNTPDTAYVAALDANGLAFSATPSDGATLGPLVPGLGIVVSPRGSQLWLDPGHPSAIAPRKRPRITPNPALVTKGEQTVMVVGCPGADAQTQGIIQVISNVIDRGMNVQEAIEAGRVVTYSAPDSFYPHSSRPGVIGVESSIPIEAREELAARGHQVEALDAFSSEVSSVCAVRLHDNRVLEGGADPRRDCLAIAW